MTDIPARAGAPEAPTRTLRRPRPEPPAPLAEEEIRVAAIRPDRLADLVLARPDRLARNLAENRFVGRLALLLLAVGVVFAVPFGAVPPVSSFWKIPVLFTGSVLICVPSLHIFGAYLGFRLSAFQNLALALVLAATASLFSLGLAPIIWFITATTHGSSDTPELLVALFLGLSLLMGVAQLIRCICAARDLSKRLGGLVFLLGAWMILLLWITTRMGEVLELL